MTAERITFPDAEALFVSYLRAELPPLGEACLVATNVPEARPDRMVKVSRTGGTQRWMIRDEPMMTFECWALDDVGAATLCGLVRAVVSAMPREDTVLGVPIYSYTEVGGPTFFPDPDTRLPRYQLTAMFDLRGKSLNR